MPSENGNHGREVRAGRDATSAVKLSQQLTAEIDAWADAHQTARSDAVRRLLELGLSVSSSRSTPDGGSIRDHEIEIEDRAAAQIEQMLDPALSPDERERRRRRLIEGPPEFSNERIDLPRHDK